MENQYETEYRQNLKVLAKTSVVVFIGIFLSKALTYLYRVMIARQYGPEVYGLFSIAVMVAGWFIALSIAGFDNGLFRYIPLYRGKRNINKIKYVLRFVSTALLISSTIFGVILLLLSETISIRIFHNTELTFFLIVFAILIPFSVMSSVYLSLLKAYERVGTYSFVFNIVQNVAKVLSLGILILIGAGIVAVAWSYVIGIGMMFILSYILARKYTREAFGKLKLSKEERRKLSKDLIKYSTPLLFFGLLGVIFYWTDSFMIGYFKDAYSVGIYNAVVPIASFLAITPELFMQLFFPLVTRYYSKGNHKMVENVSKQVSKWIFAVNLPLFLLIAIFPGTFINLLFGSEYLIAEDSLRILVVGALFSSIFIISQQLIYMAGRSKTVLFNMIAAVMLNVIINYMLVPMPTIMSLNNNNGLVGASIGTMISIIFLQILVMIQAKRYTGIIPLRRKMGLVFASIIIPFIILMGLRFYIGKSLPGIAFTALIFLALYAINLYIFKALDKEDTHLVKSVMYNLNRISRL